MIETLTDEDISAVYTGDQRACGKALRCIDQRDAEIARLKQERRERDEIWHRRQDNWRESSNIEIARLKDALGAKQTAEISHHVWAARDAEIERLKSQVACLTDAAHERTERVAAIMALSFGSFVPDWPAAARDVLEVLRGK